jgi:hypothetical protein
MTRDPQCFVAPPQSAIGFSKNNILIPDKKDFRKLGNSPDIYDDIVNRALAVQEESAVIIERAKNQETAIRRATRECLAEYTNYGTGWDGENANAIETACLRNTELLIENLPLDFIKKVGIDNIFPTPNGTMTMEVGDDSQYFVIDVGNTRVLYYYRFNNFIAGLNESVSFSEEIFQKITELFSEFNGKSKSRK